MRLHKLVRASALNRVLRKLHKKSECLNSIPLEYKFAKVIKKEFQTDGNEGG